MTQHPKQLRMTMGRIHDHDHSLAAPKAGYVSQVLSKPYMMSKAMTYARKAATADVAWPTRSRSAVALGLFGETLGSSDKAVETWPTGQVNGMYQADPVPAISAVCFLDPARKA